MKPEVKGSFAGHTPRSSTAISSVICVPGTVCNVVRNRCHDMCTGHSMQCGQETVVAEHGHKSGWGVPSATWS
jgi:hypothetical protein